MVSRERLESAIAAIRVRAVLELIEDAVRLGWTPSLSKGHVITLHAPALEPGARRESIVVPQRNNIQDGKLRTLHRKLRTYGDPTKMNPSDTLLLTPAAAEQVEQIQAPHNVSTPFGTVRKDEIVAKEPRTRTVETVTVEWPEPKDPNEGVPDADVTYGAQVTVLEVSPEETPIESGPTAPGELRNGAWVEHEGEERVICTLCEPPRFFEKIQGWASHQRAHLAPKGKVVRRKPRQLRCHYCPQTFSGINSGFRRGQHERFQHPDKKVVEKQEVVAVATQSGGMPSQEALELIKDALAEAGLLPDSTEKVRELEAQLATMTRQRDEALAERDALQAKIDGLKSVFGGL